MCIKSNEQYIKKAYMTDTSSGSTALTTQQNRPRTEGWRQWVHRLCPPKQLLHIPGQAAEDHTVWRETGDGQ